MNSNFQRTIIAIDPAGSTEENADETGIIVAGLGMDGEGYVLSDLSGRYAPHEWARRAIAAYHSYKADKIVAETNYGGAMVAATIAAIDPNVPVKEITSSRGKLLRAEPVAALFEQRRAHLVGSFPELEDQMTAFSCDWNRDRDGSPDRVDAMVFALSELMLGQPLGGFFRERSLLANGEPVDQPTRPRGCFAVIGTSGRADNDGVGAVYVALRHDYPKLVVLDWELHAVVGDSLDTSLINVAERLLALRNECEALSSAGGIWIEATPIGAALLAQGRERSLDVHDVGDHVTLGPDIIARANAAARFIASGRHVKISRAAYEKQTTVKALTRNHLMAQLVGFNATQDATMETELLGALCVASLIAYAGAKELGSDKSLGAGAPTPSTPEPPSADEIAALEADQRICEQITAAEIEFKRRAVALMATRGTYPRTFSAVGMDPPPKRIGTVRLR